MESEPTGRESRRPTLECAAGLPFTGWRELTESERRELRHAAQREWPFALLWSAVAPIVCGVLYLHRGLVGDLYHRGFAWEAPVVSAVFMIVATAVVVGFGMAHAHLQRARSMRTTADRGVRRFAGRLPPSEDLHEVELHATKFALYSVDGEVIGGWRAFELAAAVAPASASLFAVQRGSTHSVATGATVRTLLWEGWKAKWIEVCNLGVVVVWLVFAQLHLPGPWVAIKWLGLVALGYLVFLLLDRKRQVTG